MKGSDQELNFKSDPSGATISIFDRNGMMVSGGKTPVTLPLSRGDGFFQAARYKVVFEAPGFEKKEIWLTGSLDTGWYLVGNFVAGYLLGWLVIDPISGAMWNLKPSSVTASLDPAATAAMRSGLQVVLVRDISPELLAMAVPIVSKQ
jgi:hypothetical protein